MAASVPLGTLDVQPRVYPWRAEFVDAALERAYQERVHQGNAREAALALGATAVLMLVFLYTDYVALQGGAGLWPLALIRLSMGAGSLLGVAAYVKRPRLIISGRLMTGLALFGMTVYPLMIWYRAEDYPWVVATFLVMVMGVFTLLPNRLSYMVGVSIFGVANMLANTALLFEPGLPRLMALGMVLMLPVVIGFIATRRFELSRRVAFRRIIDSERANNALRAEMAERHRLEKELRRLAETDPLTGLANRRQFEADAEKEFQRAETYGLPLTLCLLDLDHFKRINDTYGHAAGDTALLEVTRICRHRLRGSDVIARLGGEEFVFLLPGTNARDAVTLCESLRSAIAEHPVEHEGTSFRLTGTIGAAERRLGEDFPTVLARADEALYRGKRGGRDRVTVAEVPGGNAG